MLHAEAIVLPNTMKPKFVSGGEVQIVDNLISFETTMGEAPTPALLYFVKIGGIVSILDHEKKSGKSSRLTRSSSLEQLERASASDLK